MLSEFIDARVTVRFLGSHGELRVTVNALSDMFLDYR